jgi:hypothetical protein
MTAEGAYPKVSGDCAYASEWNTMYAGGQAGINAIDASTENAMNITRLQYCVGITDIPHDYLVVDAFTDSNGYNNTIALSTCGTFTNTGFITSNTCCAFDLNYPPSSFTNTIGDYCLINQINANASQLTCGYHCVVSCICATTANMANYASFCFCATCTITGFVTGTCSYACNFTGCLTITGSQDDSVLCKSCVGNCFTCSIANCYCYTCVSPCCFEFYCNGAYKCSVTLTAFPNIVVSSCVFEYSGNCTAYGTVASYSITGVCYTDGTHTTSCYPTTGINAYYINCKTTTVNGCQFCNSCSTNDGTRGCAYKTIGNYYSTNCVCTTTNTSTICSCQLQCSCTCSPFSLTGVKVFGFNANCILCGFFWTGGGGGSAGTNCMAYTVCGNDDFTYSCTTTVGASCFQCTIHINVLNCYCYICASSNCWNFYCNGVCKCQVTATDFPVICVSLNMYTQSTCSSCSLIISCYCLTGIYAVCRDTKIVTNPVTWANPIKNVYLDEDKYGAGTITYNIINTTGGACLCTGLLPKCQYTMTCCVACHTYEIVQTNDNVSCIKSYAIAVGV